MTFEEWIEKCRNEGDNISPCSPEYAWAEEAWNAALDEAYKLAETILKNKTDQ